VRFGGEPHLVQNAASSGLLVPQLLQNTKIPHSLVFAWGISAVTYVNGVKVFVNDL
jgi:hypothetical protein